MQIHLDAIGGMAGDMFAAALLDAFPEHEAGVLASIRAAVRGAACELVAHNDGVLQGRRFVVTERDEAGTHDHAHRHAHEHGHHHHHRGAHAHRPWSEIRAGLKAAGLDTAVRDHALAIFGHLAEAEARVHGIPVAEVAFHEVGALDSIADIVAAAHLAAATGATGWSVSALPLGSGRVRTQHGFLPGLSNCVRALVFQEAEVDEAEEAGAGAKAGGHRDLAVIEFEVDDQTAEDLATGLDRLRARADVLDVVQMPVFGKKGRMMTHVRVLARAEALEAATEACFRETTTIGLRHRIESRTVLERTSRTVAVGGHDLRVKLAARPGGTTAKAEADDVLAQEGHAARADLRRGAERLALVEQADGEGA